MEKLKSIGFIVGVLVMSLLVGYLIFAWTEPPYGGVCSNPPCPPGGNVPAPINVGPTPQIKEAIIGFGQRNSLTTFSIPNSCGGNWRTDVRSGIWGLDYSGGCGDEWYIAWYSRGGEASTLEIAAKNDPDDHIALMPSGNVGIGTTAPAYRLDVQGGWLRVGSGSNAIQLETQSGFHRIAFEELRFWDWSFGNDMVTFKDGNVGIGTTTPEQKLEVAGKILAREPLGDWIELWPEGPDVKIIAVASSPIKIGHATKPDGTGWSEKMRIETNGNVGIGAIDPGYKLDVNGALRLRPSSQPTGANGVIYYDSGTNKFRCYQNGAWVDCIGAGGTNYWTLSGSNLYPNSTTWNVGIGITSPEQKLDVAGNIKVQQSGGIYFGGGFDPNTNYTRGGFLSFGDPGYSEDFIGYQANKFYFMDSPGGGDTAGPDVIVMGNVGIGTTAPSSKLDVVGNIEIDSWDSQLWQGYAGGNYMRRSIGGAHGWDSTRLYINGWNDWTGGVSVGGPGGTSNFYVTGNVGIGTTAPGYKLDVNGDINTSGVYRKGGTAGTSLSCGSSQVIKGATVSGGIVTAGTCAADETGGGGGAPTDASYVVLGLNGTLAAERVLTAGSAITISDGGANGNVTISHTDTSSQSSVDNSGGTVIQDITLDTYGHVTGLASTNLDTRYVSRTDWTTHDNYPSPCPSGQFVTALGDTLTCAAPPSGGIGGSGTANYVAKFTAATTIGNSQIYDNGTNVGIGTTAPGYKLDVAGDVRISGQVLVGIEIVANTCSGNVRVCTVSCPAGKRVTGGGCQGSGSYYYPFVANYPNSDTSWYCEASVSSNITAYAICARIAP